MLVQSYDTGGLVERQALSLVGDAWVTEVVPRCLPTLPNRPAPSRPFGGCEVRHPARPAAGAAGVCPGPPVDAPAGRLGGPDRAGRHLGGRLA